MKHIVFNLLFIITLQHTWAQIYEDIKVSNKIQMPEYMFCINSSEHIHFGGEWIYTREDSLYKCCWTQRYTTNYKGILFIKEYDLYRTLRAEGFMKMEKLNGHSKFKAFKLVKVGKWKHYDSNGIKISDCIYKNDKPWINCAPTIPIDTLIPIKILSVDTSSLDCYNIYSFSYESRYAQFIVEKDHDTISIQKNNFFKLCRITQFCIIDTISKNEMYVRGSYLHEGIFIVGKDTYNFDEFSYLPTLLLCEVK